MVTVLKTVGIGRRADLFDAAFVHLAAPAETTRRSVARGAIVIVAVSARSTSDGHSIADSGPSARVIVPPLFTGGT
jgi:hypothetical protein